MSQPFLSIIIPIKVTNNNQYLLSRLKDLLYQFDKQNFINLEYVVVDSSDNKNSSAKIRDITSACIKSNYFHFNLTNPYSAAKARNYGANHSLGVYLLFYDVDLIVKDDFIEKVFSHIKDLKTKSYKAFEIYPCLYLSESKTKEIEGKNIKDTAFEEIKQRYLEGFNNEVLYLAVNTSTILVNKEHFFDIGAYDETYKGHGYEDFELIHRLYMAYPIIERGDDYILDYKTNFPTQYKGFRKYYAYYALKNFFQGVYTMHLWHPRPLSGKYYRHRSTNKQYFLRQLHNSLKLPLSNQYLDKSLSRDLSLHINSLLSSYGYDRKKYCGLNNLNPDNVAIKNKNIFQRKLRKLLLHPIQFFIDMKFIYREYFTATFTKLICYIIK